MHYDIKEREELVRADETIFESIVNGFWNSLILGLFPEKPEKIELTEREKNLSEKIENVVLLKGHFSRKEIKLRFGKDYTYSELNKAMRFLLKEGTLIKYQAPNDISFRHSSRLKQVFNAGLLESY